ncbi:methyltransferase domain-containing protein [Pseudaestuariivita atlantica]|uniref:methyltransferase domain-containing protein n=1 Tax=Pseudaestuariivita atlantica TaxID=1317121 RepID=UPI00067CA25A|nr:methyltransferase domain-containing protein [Pseudaestuariivita atlantica]
MHRESFEHMKRAFDRHLQPLPAGRVIEIGSKSRKAEYRQLFTKKGWTYIGADLGEGPNVDLVFEDPFRFPLEDASFDAVISGQMLEHNTMFWLSFIEMARILKMGGHMIHIAPSRGPEHRAPTDCWRFYRDGMQALADWCGMELIHAQTDWSRGDIERTAEVRPRSARRLARQVTFEDSDWGDTIGVFRKTEETGACTGMDYIRKFAESFGAAPKKERAA